MSTLEYSVEISRES